MALAEETSQVAGLRVMAGAYRDIEMAAFDAEVDLLGYIEDLEMTSLVGMVDPPRAESKAAVADAIAAHIRVRMVTGDDVVTGAAIAKQLDIPGEAILGADFAALSKEERLSRIDDIGVPGGDTAQPGRRPAVHTGADPLDQFPG
jgi:P-type Ca2+ transporter type 2C